MHLETVFDSCRDAAGDLLRAIERRDLSAMEFGLDLLRGHLAARESASSAEDRGLAERIDALEVLAEEIDAALRRMRAETAGQMARIRAAAPLLSRLAAGDAPGAPTVH